MCFSPLASFITAGVTGTIGIVAVTRVSEPRELPLAAAPILFAVQQSIEGLLWLTLPSAPDGAVAHGLTLLFLFFAEVFWPVYAPLTVLLIEPDERRRRLICLCLAIGAVTAAYLLWTILSRDPTALIVDGHIVYGPKAPPSVALALGYLAATGLPLILSSRRTIVALGTIILIGCVTAYAFYWEAFLSVWCFFAAAASMVILGHFEWAQRRQIAGA